MVALRGFLANPPSMVLEWCGGGGLDDLLYKYQRKMSLSLEQMRQLVDEKLQLRLLVDIARGLAYLHSRDPPVAHRDLRSPNIFVRRGRLR